MEQIFWPFLSYYWLFGIMMPFASWVILVGVILFALEKAFLSRIRTTFSSLPRLSRYLTVIILLVGLIGSMPTTYIYAAIGAETGASVGGSADDLFRLPWPVFRITGAIIGYLISLVSMLAWAVALWGALAGLLSWILGFLSRVFKPNKERD